MTDRRQQARNLTAIEEARRILQQARAHDETGPPPSTGKDTMTDTPTTDPATEDPNANPDETPETETEPVEEPPAS